MEFHFPIADFIYNPSVIFGLGIGIGFFSGLIGIGSGIVMVPLLILLGFPARIAVTSQLNASIGISFAGFLSYWRKKDVDFALGFYLICGGLLGALTEFFVLRWLYNVAASYGILRIVTAIVLIVLSLAMFFQTFKMLIVSEPKHRSVSMKRWMIYIPFHRIFLRTRTEISILIPLFVGFLTGILTTSLGGGINVIMVPFLTYLIGRISPAVTGTSFLTSFVITFAITIIHGLGSAPVDIALVLLLGASSSIGTKLGSYISYYVPRIWLGALGSVVILSIGIKNLLSVIELKGKRTKIILDDGVRHYLKDLVSTAGESMSWVTKNLLLFAHKDPVLYSFVSIALSILLAYLLDKLLNRVLYR